MAPIWLKVAQQIQAIAQTGLHFSENPYDLERYKKLLELHSELVAHYSGSEPEKIPTLFKKELGYITPKVDVRAGVFKEEKILLVREQDDNRWSLPGGFADVGDPPSYAVEREVMEEAGFRVKATKLVALLDRDHSRHGHPPYEFQCYKAFFLCSLQEQRQSDILHRHETNAAQFFTLEELPELSLSRNTKSQIAMLFEHARNEGLAAEYD